MTAKHKKDISEFNIIQYAVGDFAVRQAGIALNRSLDDIYKYGNRSMGFLNVWDPNVTSDGYTGFAQRRFPVSSGYVCASENVF